MLEYFVCYVVMTMSACTFDDPNSLAGTATMGAGGRGFYIRLRHSTDVKTFVMPWLSSYTLGNPSGIKSREY